MPWAAFALMCAIYLYNLPLVFAVELDARGLRFGVGVFEPRFARRSAKKRTIGKSWFGKHKKQYQFIKKHIPLRAAVGIGVRILKSITVEYFDVRLTLGTGDAARTAQVCGLVMIVCYSVRAVSRASGAVRVTPDFAKAVLSGEACGILRLRIGHIMKAAAMYILRGAGG